MKIVTTDGRVGTPIHFQIGSTHPGVSDQVGRTLTTWLMQVRWSTGFVSWVRMHDGCLPRRYTTTNPCFKPCSTGCPDCLDSGEDYYQSTKAYKAYRLESGRPH